MNKCFDVEMRNIQIVAHLGEVHFHASVVFVQGRVDIDGGSDSCI